MIKLQVIEGGKEALEEKILQDMFSGKVCPEDIDRLRPCGDLQLVSSNRAPRAQRRTFAIPLDWLDDQTV